MRTRRRIRRRTRNRKVRNVKRNRTRGLVKRGGGKSVRNRKWIKRGGVPPSRFPKIIHVTTTDGNTVVLTTTQPEVKVTQSGATGAVTEYTDENNNSYFVKVMDTGEQRQQKPFIEYIFNIEVGILSYLANNKTTQHSTYFPKFFGSCKKVFRISDFWTIATIKPHTAYNDLKTAIDKINRMNFGGIAKQLCEGLSLLHSVNVYHRDIKLENAIINDTNQIMYIDFNGCYCKSVYKNMDEKLFRDMKMLPSEIKFDGTAKYIHPDLLREAMNYNLSSIHLYKYDYWALAQTLYKLYHTSYALDELYTHDVVEFEIPTYIEDMKHFLDQINRSREVTPDIPSTPVDSNPLSKNNNFISRLASGVAQSVKRMGTSIGHSVFSKKKVLGFKDENFKTVYDKIQTLDTELRNANCWTFTQLVTANKPLSWPPTSTADAVTTSTAADVTTSTAADVTTSTAADAADAADDK